MNAKERTHRTALNVLRHADREKVLKELEKTTKALRKLELDVSKLYDKLPRELL